MVCRQKRLLCLLSNDLSLTNESCFVCLIFAAMMSLVIDGKFISEEFFDQIVPRNILHLRDF